MARFVAKVDLPTPPFALEIAIVNLVPKIGFAKSATAEAFDHLIAQQKLKEMEKEIKHMFIWGELQHLGMDGYKELIRKRRQIKADREKQIYDQLRKRKMFFNIIKQSIIGGVAVLASISLVWWMIDLIMGAPGIQA